MDLRSVLNNSDNGDRGREPDRERAPSSKGPPTPQQAQPPQHQQTPQYYRSEYGHPGIPQQSPGKPSPQEYPPHHPQGAAYQHHPQSPYQAPGPYPNRPPPPPLQPVGSFHDPRSPGGMPAPSPTAYRAASTPSATSGPPSRGYPFPSSHGPPNEMTSPSMRQQTYPPAQYQPSQPPQPQRQDSYPHGPGPSPYSQSASVPQTPPVVTPGGSHSFIQQRSQSTQSTPTPTSAHSQHQYGPPHIHGSPVTAHQPTPSAEYNRQPSQPPTPRGPPLSTAHGQQGPQSSYPPQQQQQQLPQQQQSQPQPPSPYQQRVASAVGGPPGQTKSSPLQPQARSQEPPHQPVQHIPGPNNAQQTQSISDSPITDYHRRALSQHEREHSLSVSPKTRVPSLPSNADRNSVSTPEKMLIDSERNMTPAKRKLDDRDLSPQELEHKETRPPPGELNGYSDSRKSSSLGKASATPKPQKKRVPRTEKPVWALSIHTLGKKLPTHANFVLQERIHSHINGSKAADGGSKSRHPSPEAVKSQGARASQAGPAPTPREVVEGPTDLLGPWESTITNVEPYPEIPKMLADFLFLNIINCPDLQEIRSRGIKFEIEAKLGTLIDKDTNHRVDRALASEALLESNNRTAFKSSMTEAHHKSFNDFLNSTVIDTDPRNRSSGGKRVQVHYKHRREIDSFIELPSELQAHVPGCMLSRLSRKNVRVRVTHDQKTGEVLGRIIKARVADIDIHFPSCPMDCRISVNLEMDWDGPLDELEQLAASQRDRQPSRNKDRLSYTHGHYQVDLTQVTQQINGPGGHTRTDKEHELEIELAPDMLMEQGNRAMSGAPHRYQELVTGFLDNVRLLARKSREFP